MANMSRVKRAIPFILLTASLVVSHSTYAGPLEELKPLHWGQISLNTIDDVDPCPTNDCSYTAHEGVSGVIDDWNGGAFATGYGAKGGLVAWGGGHAGYYGSEEFWGQYTYFADFF